jgi:hypothetical protein
MQAYRHLESRMFLLCARFGILASPFKTTVLTSFLLIVDARIDNLLALTSGTLFSSTHAYIFPRCDGLLYCIDTTFTKAPPHH